MYGQGTTGGRPHRRLPRGDAESTTSSASTAPTSRISTTPRTSTTTSPRSWPSTSSPRRPWPTGYSRSGGGLGVVAATSGGGCLNLVAGLGESLASRVPVLALVGQPPTTLDGRGAFQDTSGRNGALNARGAVLGGFGVLPADPRPGPHPDRVARGDRSGPCAAAPRCCCCPRMFSRPPSTPTARRPAGRRHRPAVGDPQPIARALRMRRGPVTIIAGEQVARDDARDELERLRAALHARIATVPDAKDVSRPGRGVIVAGRDRRDGPSRGGDAIAQQCAVPADRHPLAGHRPRRAGRGAGAVPMLPRSGPPRRSFRLLTCTPTIFAASLATADAGTHGDGRPTGVRVPDVVPHGRAATARRTTAPACGTARRWPRSTPRCPTVSTSSSTPGTPARRRSTTCLPAATADSSSRSAWAAWDTASAPRMGCAFGRGDATVVIAGDGSFFMHGMEIHTAVQYRLPVTFLLFNNHAHAMCVTREQLFYGDLYSYNRFGPSRLGAGLAAMFPGLQSVDVDDHRRSAVGACRPHSRSTDPRSSASSAPPTKSRRSQTFSARRP